MAKFSAGSVVGPLDWTFEPHVHAEGVIAEPTDPQIAAFLIGRQRIAAEARRQVAAAGKAAEAAGDADDPDAAIAALDDSEAALELHKRTADLYEALCSGSPSAEQILGLPMRVRTLFYGWLAKEVMDPEAVPGGGSSQVKTLRSVAAG